MKQSDLKGKSVKDLKQMEVKLREELFELNMQHATAQLKQTSKIKQVKKQIARVLGAVSAA